MLTLNKSQMFSVLIVDLETVDFLDEQNIVDFETFFDYCEEPNISFLSKEFFVFGYK